MKRIFEREFNIFGAMIKIRIEPEIFRQDLEYINALVANKQYKAAADTVEIAGERWNWDTELVRCATLISFLSGHE